MLRSKHREFAPLIAFVALGTATCDAGVLQNGDFTDGFEFWTGQTTDISFSDNEWTPAEMEGPSAVSGLFEIPAGGGEATLVTDSTYFNTGLFQAFDVDVSAGGPVTLSFDFSWALTDSSDRLDFVQASLDHTGGQADLFDGRDTSALTDSGSIIYDITALAGQPVTLYFFVEDGGDDVPDRLTIGNIRVNAAVAPIPGTLFLFAAGLLGLLRLHSFLVRT
jgi:hypothetical protein